jgi:hypothetical protein
VCLLHLLDVIIITTTTTTTTIIIIIISFMVGIYTYIPETNLVPREYSAAAVLCLLFMVHMTIVPMLNLP